MATTFGQLKSRVLGNIIDAPSFVSSAIGDLVNQAIEDLAADHSFKVMRSLAPFTTTAATRTLGTMPSDFKEFVQNERPYYVAQDGSSTPIDMLPSEDQALREFSYNDPTDTGAPRGLTWELNDPDGNEATLSVWPFSDSESDWTSSPAGEYRIYVPYYRFLDALTDDSDTNWFTNFGYKYIEHYATALGFLKDWDEQHASTWFTTASGFRSKLIKFDASLRTSPRNVLVPRSDVNASVLRVRW